MGVILFLVVVALFVLLTPGILLSLPPKGSKLVVALTHGIVFAIVLKLIYKPLWKFTSRLEGLEGMEEDDEPIEGIDEEKEDTDEKDGMEGMIEGNSSGFRENWYKTKLATVREERNDTITKLTAARKSLADLSSRSNTLAGQVTTLTTERNSSREELNKIITQLNNETRDRKQQEDQVRSLTAQIDALKKLQPPSFGKK